MGMRAAVVVDPPSFSRYKGLGNKLQALARLAPDDVKAIEVFVDEALRNRLWQQYRAQYGGIRPKTLVMLVCCAVALSPF